MLNNFVKLFRSDPAKKTVSELGDLVVQVNSLEPEFEKLDKNVKDYEPHLALQGGFDGLAVYRRITDQVNNFLKPDAALMMEIGYAQGPAVRELLEQTGAFAEIKIEKDVHNNDRIVTAKRILS